MPRGNFMRGIDCAHSRSVKTLPWFRVGVGILTRQTRSITNDDYCSSQFSDENRKNFSKRLMQKLSRPLTRLLFLIYIICNNLLLLKGVQIIGHSLTKNFSQYGLYRGNFMRGIDCAHSRTVKTLPWPWFREGIGVLKRKSIYLRKELYSRRSIQWHPQGGVVKSNWRGCR